MVQEQPDLQQMQQTTQIQHLRDGPLQRVQVHPQKNSQSLAHAPVPAERMKETKNNFFDQSL
jgi:hypothetical protein